VIAAIIRHGDYLQLPHAPSAHQPFPLKPEGEVHARHAADAVWEMLNRHGWRLIPSIDSSNMLRAWQTAEIIAIQLAEKGMPKPVVKGYDQLAERGVGCLANLTTDQIMEIVQRDPRYPDPPPDWKSNSHYRLPLQGAESLMEAGKRVAQHLQQCMDKLQPQPGQDSLKLFVGHGAAFRHAAYHMGILSFDQIGKLSMYHGHPVYLEYLPGGEWLHLDGDWKVRAQHEQYTD
jgi:2,3-bisphosphoglycerate-dependent phosphoglycerate mutase